MAPKAQPINIGDVTAQLETFRQYPGGTGCLAASEMLEMLGA